MPTTGIAMGPDGFLYMSNNIKGTIMKLNADGKDIVAFSSGLITPRNIIFDQNNNMFVAAAVKTNGAIYRIDNTGNPALVFSDPDFKGWEIAVDSAGNFYGADHFNNRIRLIEKNGRIVTLAGSGKANDVDGIGLSASFDGPQGITTDTEGNIYVTTYNHEKKTGNKVRKIVVE
jgi:sugar lactone lactonase YvrE